MDRNEITLEIQRWLEEHVTEATALVQSLVRIPSVNNPPTGEELKCQQFIASWLKRHGAEVELYELEDVPGLKAHPAYMATRQYENRPNVVGCFHGRGGGQSLLFSSHVDTVYAGKEVWKYPPFSGWIEGDKLYGRGAFDMKGGMAASMVAVWCLRELGIQLRGDVWIESVVDEEYGGANGTLAGRLYGTAADMAIIPEPTNLQACPAHIGGGMWKAEFSGKGGIGFSGEELVSALEATVAFACLLQQYGEERNQKIKPPDWWQGESRLAVLVNSIAAGDLEREIQEKLPATGELTFWIESFPGMTGEEIIRDLWRFYESKLADYPLLQKVKPKLTPLIRYLQGSELRMDHNGKRIVEVVKHTGQRILKESYLPMGGTVFACDGFMFNIYSDTPALILGPSGGNAHAADEFLDIPSYLNLIRWYAEIIIDWCGREEV